MRIAKTLIRSDWADAQADLSLRWVHTHFVGFVMSWLTIISPVDQPLVTPAVNYFSACFKFFSIGISFYFLYCIPKSYNEGH